MASNSKIKVQAKKKSAALGSGKFILSKQREAKIIAKRRAEAEKKKKAKRRTGTQR